MSIYVASSWRNHAQPFVVNTLRAAGLDVYDFRHPGPDDNGFRWVDVGLKQFCRCDHTRGRHGFCAAHGEPVIVRGDPDWPEGTFGSSTCGCPTSDECDPDAYLTAIEHPVAVDGFDKDFAAMEAADAFVLVLPCGRSAHLELGWAVGAGKRTAILLDDPVTPELMYRMADYIAPSLFDLLGWLGVRDEIPA